MKARYRFTAVLILMFLSFSVFAQRGAIVKMTFTDSNTGAPVEFATVALTVKGGDSIYKYLLTDSNGSVTFTDRKSVV